MPKFISNNISILLLIGIAAAIAMSAIHVGKFLYATDGPLALLGGAAIAICTISSSYYAFDSTKAGKGWPWTGVIFFGLVSAVMQINHYQLVPAIADTTAIAMGILWPIGEIILGGIMASVRHGERVEMNALESFKSERSKNVQLEQSIETLKAERLFELYKLNDERDAERFGEQERISELERTLNELRIENAKLSERAAIKNSSATPGTHDKNAPGTDTDKRRLVVLDFYRSNPGVPYSAAAESLGLGKTTIYNDVKFWEKRGTIHVNGNGVEVVN